MARDKAYIVKWFGPFFNREELEDWEVLHDFKSQLYLLHGKKKYAKTKEYYYCGMTTRTAYKRFKDANHHIGEIENRDHNIYVGHFTNLIPSTKDIKLVEKLLTSYLDYFIGRKSLLNKTNFYAPNCVSEVSIINRWYNCRTVREYQRTPTNSPAHIVPDVLVYRVDDNTGECKLVIAPRLTPTW